MLKISFLMFCVLVAHCTHSIAKCWQTNKRFGISHVSFEFLTFNNKIDGWTIELRWNRMKKKNENSSGDKLKLNRYPFG